MTSASADPLITVVIVSWNGRHLLDGALRGLAGQTLDSRLWRVLVVDNASTDGTAEYLAREHPSVDVLRSTENRGFAGGNHLALATVTTPYAVLLNNDATPEPGFLAALLDAVTAEGAERVAAVTAKVLLQPRFAPLPPGTPPSPGSGDLCTPSGVYRPSAPGTVDLVNSTGNVVDRQGYGRDRSWLRVDAPPEDPPDVFAFCGAAAVLRMEALRDVGDFDEDFFLYYEDTDLSWRLRAAGWTIRYEPRAVVRHEHAASSDVRSALFRFHDDRNRLLTLTKNAPASIAARAVLRYPATIASLTVRHGPKAAMTATRLHALASYLRLLPRMLRRRRALARRSVVDVGQLAALLERYPPPVSCAGAAHAHGAGPDRPPAAPPRTVRQE
jgi:N-acetylglucosaminyl-diphospho-decaprenol L-rhamnosyltransferase